ncbi:hypothetical protein VNO80_25172 [Phaseolus coccineus]|uniref:Uncharacterized protein n=1 Tax=Phaseolus coccineus TaxID=3886 RepID=A0AAN9QT31_PHACN
MLFGWLITLVEIYDIQWYNQCGLTFDESYNAAWGLRTSMVQFLSFRTVNNLMINGAGFESYDCQLINEATLETYD